MTDDKRSIASGGSQFASNVEEIMATPDENNEVTLTLEGDVVIKRHEIDCSDGMKLLRVFEYPKQRNDEEYDVTSVIIIGEADNKPIRVGAIVVNRGAISNKQDITDLNVLRELPEYYDALKRQMTASKPMASHAFQATLRYSKDFVLACVDQPAEGGNPNARYKIVVRRNKSMFQRKQRALRSENLVLEQPPQDIVKYHVKHNVPIQETLISDTIKADSKDDGGQPMIPTVLGIGSVCALIGLSYFLVKRAKKSPTNTHGPPGRYSTTTDLQ